MVSSEPITGFFVGELFFQNTKLGLIFYPDYVSGTIVENFCRAKIN